MYPTVNPYKDLYIYYLEGYPNSTQTLSGEGFIGNWEEDGFSFLFFSRGSDVRVKKMIASQPHLKLLDHFYMTYDQWHGDPVASFSVGDLKIIPPWEKSNENGDMGNAVHRIFLDPGVVFGTGTHSTTRDCLEAVQVAFREQKPNLVLDIGTGTGILALAAARLGCPHTIALDLNYLSVQTTQRNIRLNHLTDKVLAVRGSAINFMDCPADFVIANIHYDITEKLLNSDEFYNKKRFILSGLLKSEARVVADTLRQRDVEIKKVWDQNGIWFTYLGEIT